MTASSVQSHSNTRPPSFTTVFQSCVPELTAVLTILRHVEVRVNGLLQAFAHYRVLCTVFSLAEDHGAAKKTCLETYLLVFEKTILLVCHERVHQKCQFCHHLLHVVPNMYEFLSFVEHKIYFEECNKVNGCLDYQHCSKYHLLC